MYLQKQIELLEEQTKDKHGIYFMRKIAKNNIEYVFIETTKKVKR